MDGCNRLPTYFQEFVHLSRYARWIEAENRRETWAETVKRYLDFFCDKQCKGKVSTMIRNELEAAILNLEVMPSMRALMTAGPALERDNCASYNCSFVALDHPYAFDEALYLLLCGVGVGISVERQFICELPNVPAKLEASSEIITVADSKVGWAEAFRHLIKRLYEGKIPKWDVSKVRPAGMRLKTFGGRASGPGPLEDLFRFTINIFQGASVDGGRKLNSIECHDICCKVGEAVVSGGVRRSAIISLSNPSDDRMRYAKSGDWWKTNKQRELANNCLVEGTLVAKKGNPCCPIEKIAIGDEVMSCDGWRRVTKIFDQGIRDTVLVRHQNGWFRCTPKHRVAVVTSLGSYQWKAAGKLAAGDYLAGVPIVDNTAESPALEWETGSCGFNEHTAGFNMYSKTVPIDGLDRRGISFSFVPSAVLSVEETEPCAVYDLEIDGDKQDSPQCYVGACVLQHNSAAYTEKPSMEVFMREWLALFESKSGERGIFNRDAAKRHMEKFGRRNPNFAFGVNPCGELVLRPSGELCNLTEVVVRPDDDVDSLRHKVKLATILGTMQATLTDFRYLRPIWKKNCEEEALLGVSLTGIFDNNLTNGKMGHDRLADALDHLRLYTREVNANWADKLGINRSVATTCTKPSGTVSLLCNCSSGIHPRFARYYVRRVRSDKRDPVSQLLVAQSFPHEDDSSQPENRYVFSFPMESPAHAIFAEQITALDHLKLWLVYRQHWTEHNPSCTVFLREHEWLAAGAWVYEHFNEIGGITFLPFTGHAYHQAPLEELTKEKYQELCAKMPKKVDWSKLKEFEKEDSTSTQKELACAGDACELPQP